MVPLVLVKKTIKITMKNGTAASVAWSFWHSSTRRATSSRKPFTWRSVRKDHGRFGAFFWVSWRGKIPIYGWLIYLYFMEHVKKPHGFGGFPFLCGKSPIAGWFISWKIQKWNGMDFGVPIVYGWVKIKDLGDKTFKMYSPSKQLGVPEKWPIPWWD